MSYIEPVNNVKTQANYNAVKVAINNPRTNVAENFKPSADDNGIYNAVDLQVNNPRVNLGDPFYKYIQTQEPVNASTAGFMTKPSEDIKVLPASMAYTSSISEENNESKIVPEPNVTTVENEKLTFNGKKKDVEIVQPKEVKPAVDIPKVISNLSSDNMDTQAKQMAEIVIASVENPDNFKTYITKDVFVKLIDIINKDNTGLAVPSEETVAIREKIITNEMEKLKAESEGKNPKEVKLPYELTEDDYNKAVILSPFELAERNKEYALNTLAVLSKAYADDVYKETGDVVPLTDLPGASDIVNSITKSENPSIQLAAMESLLYINRPEYTQEIKSVLNIAKNDDNAYIAQAAGIMLEKI